MYCIQCGNPCDPNDRFCTECGTPLVTEQLPDTKKPKKGRLWVPIAVLVIMMAVGISAFFLFRSYSDPEAPWFSLKNGVLYFDASLYDGGEELTVPSTIDGQPVKQISDYCFYQADGITAIRLPEGVEHIGSYAFGQSATLRAVKLPETVTFIGDAVFYGCTGLEAVYIPGSVKQMGQATFMGCDNLRHVFYGGTGQQWDVLHTQTLPENASVYLVDGESYELYIRD